MWFTLCNFQLKLAGFAQSTKNVEELFAECFALYCQRKKLPQAFVELLEDSLSRAKVEGKGLGNDNDD